MTLLSNQRKSIIQGNTIVSDTEESKSSSDIVDTFYQLTTNTLSESYILELFVSF